MSQEAQFGIGQLINHQLFGYRGVIIDIDPIFSLSEEWYQQMAKSRPPKDLPWYHVLVHDGNYQTYVAQQNLEQDDSNDPIHHPDVDLYFDGFNDGQYHLRRKSN